MKVVCMLIILLISFSGCSINNIEMPQRTDEIVALYEISGFDKNYWKNEIQIVEDIRVQLDDYEITDNTKKTLIENPQNFGMLYLNVEIKNNSNTNVVINDFLFSDYVYVNKDNFISPMDFQIEKNSSKNLNLMLLVDLKSYSNLNNDITGCISLYGADKNFEINKNAYLEIEINKIEK